MSIVADKMPEKTAVLLLAFGGPDSLDDIESFLGNIIQGRRLSPDLVKEIAERYKKIGGCSPLKEITLDQARSLKRILCEKGFNTDVYVGMRYWSPYIKDSLRLIADGGYQKVLAIVMAPHDSAYTVNGYRHDLERASDGFSLSISFSLISGWYNNQKYQMAVCEKIRKGLLKFPSGKKTVVVFTPHSLPVRFMKPDDPYVPQIMETIDGITALLGEPIDWRLAYQSKGMIPGEWLGPSVDDVLAELPGEGAVNVLLVPVGFCSDHVETLYDVDIVYREQAEKLGLDFARSESLNSAPTFIEGLSEIVLEND